MFYTALKNLEYTTVNGLPINIIELMNMLIDPRYIITFPESNSVKSNNKGNTESSKSEVNEKEDTNESKDQCSDNIKPEMTNSDLKLKKIADTIEKLILTYDNDHKNLMEEYNNGNVQTCVKVEAETVYTNLIKVLNKIKEIVNE